MRPVLLILKKPPLLPVPATRVLGRNLRVHRADETQLVFLVWRWLGFAQAGLQRCHFPLGAPSPMVCCYPMRVVALVVCTAGLASSLAAANCVPYVGAPILQLLIAMTGPPPPPTPTTSSSLRHLGNCPSYFPDIIQACSWDVAFGSWGCGRLRASCKPAHVSVRHHRFSPRCYP